MVSPECKKEESGSVSPSDSPAYHIKRTVFVENNSGVVSTVCWPPQKSKTVRIDCAPSGGVVRSGARCTGRAVHPGAKSQ